ncbi:hypothetical protein AJ78_03130 [Emergomyces pasteurianus Ep9510]|uniref:Uncharacterized protein n=1 Tax=Emergomyces pasteurianus Ep9510 TaxID=1447872 RepID=A0A1J9PJS3_9EURO|nr:hypothetical protein AJ78_03130 [Emergomyces pasteurianus Ep9510]
MMRLNQIQMIANLNLLSDKAVEAGYKNHRTPSLSVTQSSPSMSSSSLSSALSGHAGTSSSKRALESSHLYPEFPRKRATYPDSSVMFLGQGNLELQEDGRPSVVMSCTKHSSDQKFNIWQEHCSNSECTLQRNEPVWSYGGLSEFRIKNRREYVRVDWHAS